MRVQRAVWDFLWYFRTLGGWRALLAEQGFRLRTTHEPRHPTTGAPCSVIFEVEVASVRDH